MQKLHITAAFIAGILDGLGWTRVRNWLSDRIEWTGKEIDAFDRSSDWFMMRHIRKRDSGSGGR